jgi:hypothetical protein
MENMKVLLDRLEQATRARRMASGSVPAGNLQASRVPGLRFQEGDKVLDLASGRKGTVVAAARDDATGRQAYSVDLITGETVFRSVSELGADVRPRAPGSSVG